MAAYLINDMEITDPVAFEEYRKLAPPTIALYGGKYHVRGGAIHTLEGTWSPKRVVILEFESVERAKAWLESPEYAAARKLRQASSRSNIIIIEGVAP